MSAEDGQSSMSPEPVSKSEGKGCFRLPVFYDEIPTGLLAGPLPSPEYAKLELELQDLADGIKD